MALCVRTGGRTFCRLMKLVTHAHRFFRPNRRVVLAPLNPILRSDRAWTCMHGSALANVLGCPCLTKFVNSSAACHLLTVGAEELRDALVESYGMSRKSIVHVIHSRLLIHFAFANWSTIIYLISRSCIASCGSCSIPIDIARTAEPRKHDLRPLAYA